MYRFSSSELVAILHSEASATTVLLLFSLVLGLHHQPSIVYSLDEKNLAKHFISTRVEDPLHEQGYGGMEPR